MDNFTKAMGLVGQLADAYAQAVTEKFNAAATALNAELDEKEAG